MTEEKKLEPELRFPGFHEPWEEKKLGDVLEVRPNKFNPKTDDKFSYSIELENIEQNSGRLLGLSKINKKSSTKNIFDEHNILFSKLRPYLKKFFKPTKVGVCSSEIWVFNVKNNENLDYIYNLIQTNRFISIANITTGTRMPRADWSYMRGKKFSFPSLQEQEKIGKFFYSIDKKLNLQRERIEELKSYKKGMMQRIFDQEIRFKDEDGRDYPDWEEKKLGDVGEFLTSSVNKKINSEEEIVRLYNYMDVYNKVHVTNENINLLDITSATENQIDRNNLNKGDILITPSSETPEDIGHSIVIKENLKNTVYSYHLLRFRPNIKMDILFSNYWFNDENVRKEFIIRAQGATRFTVSISNIKDILVRYPCFQEQEKIGSFLSAIDRRIELEEEKLELYEDFKKGLMQRMFV